MADLIRREASAPPVSYQPRETIWIDQYVADKEGELTKYYRAVLKRKKVVVAATLSMLAAAGLWTYYTKPMYSSSVRIQIEPGAGVLPYKDIYEPVTDNPRYLETQVEVLRSESLLSRVVLRLGLADTPERASSLVGWFKANLEVKTVEGTQVVGVTFKHEDQKFVAQAINLLADEYVDYSIEIKREATTKARDFLQIELTKLEPKLQAAERQLARYAREHNMLVGDETDTIAVRKLTDLNTEITKVEAELLANRFEMIRSSGPANFPEGMKTSAMREVERKIASAQDKLTVMSNQFGPRWPEVVSLKSQLQDLDKELAAETRRAIDQERVSYSLASAHRNRLTKAIQDQNRQVDQLAQDGVEFNVIKREVETSRQVHEGLLQRLKETDISAGLKAANIHVIDRGKVPNRPFSPNIPRNLAAGLLLGLLAGVVLACFVDASDNTVRTPEDAEQTLHLPLLAVVPVFDSAWKAKTNGLLAQSSGDPEPRMLVPVGGSSDVTYWESYRSLRTALLLSRADSQPQTILVTSALPGEGKTTTAMNLAISLAQTGARTLIVELDLRKPKLASLLRLPESRGISEYLSGQTELNHQIQQTGIPNLFAVPAGPIPPNPAELIGSSRANHALPLLSQFFDFIVVDGPPVVPVTDALIIAAQVDGVLLVVKSGETKKPAVVRARKLLHSVDACVLGLVVNNVPVNQTDGYGGHYVNYGSAQTTAHGA